MNDGEPSRGNSSVLLSWDGCRLFRNSGQIGSSSWTVAPPHWITGTVCMYWLASEVKNGRTKYFFWMRWRKSEKTEFQPLPHGRHCHWCCCEHARDSFVRRIFSIGSCAPYSYAVMKFMKCMRAWAHSARHSIYLRYIWHTESNMQFPTYINNYNKFYIWRLVAPTGSHGHTCVCRVCVACGQCMRKIWIVRAAAVDRTVNDDFPTESIFVVCFNMSSTENEVCTRISHVNK